MENQLNTQGVTLKKGDKFMIEGGNIVYTFHFCKNNDKYSFPEMFTSSDIDDKVKGSFRIDNMIDHKLFINKI